MTTCTQQSVCAKQLPVPLKWHGGKSYLAAWINSYVPPHVHYVEPFAGGLAVLLGRDPEGISEVVNDLDGELTNFWRVLRDEESYRAFVRLVEATPFSEIEFDQAKEPPPSDCQIDRAVRFFVRCRQSRQGLRKNFATLSKNRTRRQMNEQVSSWLTAIDGLPEIHDRLKRVVILNEDALTVIRQEDSPNTFYYLDPPYLHETRVTTKDFQHEMSIDDHRSLLIALSEIDGKFILSGYRNDMYDAYADLNNWRRIDKEIDCKASAAKEKPKRVESLWMNFWGN